MADDDKKNKADGLKQLGNQALAESKLEEALKYYTEALSLDENQILYSNRSAAHIKAGNYREALEDAEKAIEMKPDWAKGYSRKGAALCYLKRYEEATIAYEEGAELDPDNKQIKEGLAEAKKHLTGPGNSQPIQNPFAGPNAMAKLMANPKTRKYMEDPMFMNYFKLLQQDSKNLNNIQDPRIIETLGVLLGMDLSSMEVPDDDMKEPSKTYASKASETKSQAKSDSYSTKASANSDKASMSEGNQKALEAKEKGNTAYKAKRFDEAIQHYDEAIGLDPTNITYLNNKAAVYFEMNSFDECIQLCDKAVDIGRENRADYTHIAKVFARAGKSYMKKEDEENALRYLNKSLSEHRTPDVQKLVQELQKKIKEKERLTYINPELAQQEKEKGNQLYQNGKYPEAIKHYDEAIKRNPSDAKLYSNRAACYMKLLEFNLALRDSEDCIKLDPTFIKGYLRKGAILTAMKEVSKATQCYAKALELDPNNQEAQTGYRSSLVEEGNDPEAVRRRAMADPEVQQILSDPAMRMILEQMQKDPNALKEHLKNPQVAHKIEKLLECGIIAIR